MRKMIASSLFRQRGRLASFTLIELLVAMAIIVILIGLVIYAFPGVQGKTFRSRANVEIQAMSTALEGYKTDNGAYPQASGMVTNYTTVDVKQTGAGSYIVYSEILYTALSGQTNFADPPLSAGKSYMSFKANQLGNITTAGASSPASTYVEDPWKYPYGYSTGTGTGGATTNYPYNGNGFFDLWSTGGITGTAATNVNAWISNW